MRNVIHFDSQKERLAYLRGEYEEITPIEAKIDSLKPEIAEKTAKSALKSEKSAVKRKKGKKK